VTEKTALGSEEEGAFPRPFGRFLLLHSLGQGGMGDVYLAKHSGLADIERYCVVKVVATTRGKPKQHVARFFDEARVVVHLNHQNICSVFDLGEVAGELYLAMDYVAGENLNGVLRERGRQNQPMKTGLALFVLCELLTALDYAHRLKHPTSGESLGIVHRDVSPQNVLLSFEGEVKLIDFGVAVSSLKQERTSEGFILGKLAYISPEQARSETVEFPADIYAAGIIAYELITGQRYYAGLTKHDLIGVISAGDHVPKGWNSIESDLAKIINKALAQDPAARYETCSQFRKTLEQYRRDSALTAGADELRAYMRTLFPDGEENTRQLLAGYADVAAPSPESITGPIAELSPDKASDRGPEVTVTDMVQVAVAGLPGSGPAEDTFSGAAETDLMPSVPGIAPTSDEPIPEFTSPISVRRPRFDEISIRTRPRRRARLLRWIAVAALVALAVVALVALVRDSDPEPQPVVLDVRDQPIRPAVVEAESSPPPVVAAADAAAAEVELALDIELKPTADEPDAAAVDSAGDRKRSTSKKRRRRDRGSGASAATVGSPASPAKPPPTTTAGKLQLMKDCTGRRPCARKVLEKSKQLRELPFDEVRRFPAELDQCVKRCRR